MLCCHVNFSGVTPDGVIRYVLFDVERFSRFGSLGPLNTPFTLFMLRVLLCMKIYWETRNGRLAARFWRSRLMRHQEVSPQTDIQAGWVCCLCFYYFYLLLTYFSTSSVVHFGHGPVDFCRTLAVRDLFAKSRRVGNVPGALGVPPTLWGPASFRVVTLSPRLFTQGLFEPVRAHARPPWSERKRRFWSSTWPTCSQ